MNSVFTLALCVWTAIHLNVPPQGEDQHRQWCRKAKWVLVAIFAPELAVFTAWQQFYWAKRLLSSLRDVETLKEERGNDLLENSTHKKVSDSSSIFCSNVHYSHKFYCHFSAAYRGTPHIPPCFFTLLL
jgi:hypothetical protein